MMDAILDRLDFPEELAVGVVVSAFYFIVSMIFA